MAVEEAGDTIGRGEEFHRVEGNAAVVALTVMIFDHEAMWCLGQRTLTGTALTRTGHVDREEIIHCAIRTATATTTSATLTIIRRGTAQS